METKRVCEPARSRQSVHRFSTLATAQNLRDFLSTEDGIRAAVDWCKKTRLTKVYLETYRDGYQASASTLRHAKELFLSEGFDVSGCVTPTQVGKPSTGWKELISCYTDQATQRKVQSIFEYAAQIFDEIMVDDFWFTDCACPECDAARRSKTVTVGERTYTVADDSWESYRCELMVNLSRERVLAPARHVKPDVKVIIKYPHWYDLQTFTIGDRTHSLAFRERGYDVVRETIDFNRIWVGTETRDYDDPRRGGVAQYRAYFLMRWLQGIGGEKCGGGWYDPHSTTEHTYLEQARQTVLGGARESLLFCYGSLLRDTGPRNIEVLRENVSELLAVSEQVRRRKIVGVAACNPPNGSAQEEKYVFDFVGMMGLPLVPCHEFPLDAPAAFFSVHALASKDFTRKLSTFVASGKPVLVTDGLVKRLTGGIDWSMPNIDVLHIEGNPKSLLQMPQRELDAIRELLLSPLKVSFQAVSKVALYLFSDGSWVIENFNDKSQKVKLNQKQLEIPSRGWRYQFVGD